MINKFCRSYKFHYHTFYFSDSSRYLAVTETMLNESLRILKDNSELTFLITMKQEKGNSGSLLAFSSEVLR